jgi:hypothetical protein
MATRYFQTNCARKAFQAGGRGFVFEPVGNWGGSWFGVLATDDESEASILAAACGGTLEEISFEQYDAKKKHLTVTQSGLPGSPRPQPENPLNHAVADRVGSLSPVFKNNGGPNSTENVTRVSIFQTSQQPPKEPILEGAGVKRRW